MSLGPDGVQCTSVEWVSPTQVTCEPPTGLAMGPLNVTVSLERLGRVQVSNPVTILMLCSPGTFAQPGELWCVLCPPPILCLAASIAGVFALGLCVCFGVSM